MSNEPIYCPSPECQTKRRQEIYLVERNYSGCGVDHFYCNNCKQSFMVSYKVDKITKVGG